MSGNSRSLSDNMRIAGWSVVSSLVVALLMLYLTQSISRSQKLAETVERMQRAQQTIAYRLDKAEAAVERSRDNRELIRRLCNAVDRVTCNLAQINPRVPPAPTPSVASQPVARGKRSRSERGET